MNYYLKAIFWGSSLLMGISLFMLMGLVIRRAFLTRREKREEIRKAFLMDRIMECLNDAGAVARLRAGAQPGDRRILTLLLSSLTLDLEGEDKARIVELMCAFGFVEEHLAALKSRRWWHRAEACAALRWYHEPRVVEALKGMLDDPNHDVRVEAAIALVRIHPEVSPRLLLRKLVEFKPTRSLLVKDIFHRLGPAAVPELIQVLEGDEPDAVKAMAVETLGWIGDLRGVDAILQLCSHSSAAVRLMVVRSLGLLGDPQAIEVLPGALTDPIWEVRAEAAISAGLLGAAEMVPELQKRLTDNEWWVRYHAATALFTLGEGGLDVLEAACTSPVPREAAIARSLLREKGRTDLIPKFIY